MKFPIGYVGVGLMGGPMVKRLTSLGWKVRGYDIVPERSMRRLGRGSRAGRRRGAAQPADQRGGRGCRVRRRG